MKALIVLANGFEDVEAIATIDILKRGNVSVVSTSLDEKEVITKSGLKVISDITLKDVSSLDYDFLILPGGPAVFNILDCDKRIDSLIASFYEQNKLICAICAAPLLIGKGGYFKGLNYTCFPGCNSKIKEGTLKDDGVVVEKNFITAKAMYYTVEFAIKILEKVCSKEIALEVLNSIKGCK